jgi:hypothetical protein
MARNRKSTKKVIDIPTNVPAETVVTTEQKGGVTAPVAAPKSLRESYFLSGGKGPDPEKLAKGIMEPRREGYVFKALLNGDGDGTAKGILSFLAANRPEDYKGLVREPTVTYFLRAAVKAGIIESVQFGGATFYLPLDPQKAPTFALGTQQGLELRSRILSAMRPTPSTEKAHRGKRKAQR